MWSEKIGKEVESYREEMIELMKDIVSIPSISPASGGEGEAKRADMLESFLKKSGFNVRRYDYIDNFNKKRSNLIATIPSKAKQRIWLLSHIDTVPEGDRSLWNHDPFDAYVKDGKIFGRGTSDNGQGIVSSIFALKALKELGVETKYAPAIALVADEEVGSEYGVKALLKEKIFSKGDMFVVPDWGNEKGDMIEIAEKGILWLKFTVVGRQVHASTPQKGINAFKVSAELVQRLNKLYKLFGKRDRLFDPSFSTFEPTKHEKNVESINIIPGREVFYMDCRVLPEYSLAKVIKLAKNEAARLAKESNAQISVDVYNIEEPAKPTSKNSQLVRLLSRSIENIKGIKPKLVGIGGGTVAKYFREKGMDCAVWATLPDNAHQPNEYVVIDSMVDDSKVFAYLYA
ncbi:MAG: M20 family metallo-hydrolase [Candidatus Micrarchaeia archaeon]